jgi:hypothetical protein
MLPVLLFLQVRNSNSYRTTGCEEQQKLRFNDGPTASGTENLTNTTQLLDCFLQLGSLSPITLQKELSNWLLLVKKIGSR